MGKYFGTDGIRGEVNKELTVDLAFNVGKTLSSLKCKTICIGYDTRISNHMLANAISSGALAVGKDVIDVGVISTPALCYYSHLKQIIGVMITASHNPFTDNGIKIFYNGEKINKEQENEIEYLIDNPFFQYDTYASKYYQKHKDAIKSYMELIEKLKIKTNLKLWIDSANGATYQIAKKVFNDTNNYIKFMGNKPNGLNINFNVGSTNIDNLFQIVKQNNYDYGFAYDGDGDRVLLCDINKVYTGDEIIYAIATILLPKNSTIVLTKVSNLGVINSLKDKGYQVLLSDVGDKNVLHEMKLNNAFLGGESSGHIINRHILETGDGILSSLVLLNILEKTKKTMSELVKDLTIYPEEMRNIKVKNKAIVKDSKIIQKVQDIKSKHKDNLQLIVRASGTENLVRIFCCANKKDLIDKYIEEIIDLIRSIEGEMQ